MDIERGTMSRLERGHTAVLMVKAASDGDAARSVLARFVVELMDPSSWSEPEMMPPFAVGPIDTPLGPFIVIDPKDLPGRRKAALATALAKRLVDAGVGDAVISFPRASKRWAGTYQQPGWDLVRDMQHHWHHSVYLAMFQRPELRSGMRPEPGESVRLAVEWLTARGADLLALFEGNVQIPVAADSALLVAQAANGHAFLRLIGGDPGSLAFGIGLSPFGGGLFLVAGGAALDATIATEIATEFEQVALACTSTVYACVGVDHGWDSFARTYPVAPEDQLRERLLSTDPSLQPPYRQAHRVCAELVDEYVPDAFPWQLLTAGHLDRLGPAQSLHVLDHGRAILQVGELTEWWPAEAPPAPLALGRNTLAPLLIDRDDHAHR